MRSLRLVRTALAVLVIAHGLAQAVIPMRGLMTPAVLAGGDAMPIILYAFATLGFLVAGLGLLGLTPFTAATRPALVVASAYSLIALYRLGYPDLWLGAAIDGALLMVGLTGVYRFLPTPESGASRLRHWTAVAGAVALLGYVAYAGVLWPWHRAWGSTYEEYAMALPGDEPNRNPAMQIQHAVTIDAPPSAVWPWLMQLGQDRGGFYSYDWLERAFGVDVHNVNEIRPEWQQREVGELLRGTQATYLGGLFGPDVGWTVKDVQFERALVLEGWGAFVLVPTADGKTRFIIRTTISNERVPVWAATLNVMAFQVPHFIMERRMMLQIKELAEGMAERTLADGRR
jgi:hypothetical protein